MVGTMYGEAIEAQAGMLQHVRRLGYTDDQRMASHLYKGTISEYQPALRRVQHCLEGATPFFWDHDLCSVLEACAPSMPEWELDIAELPARTGFIHFGRPLRLPMPPEETIRQAVENGRRSKDVPLDARLDVVGMAWQVLDGDEVFISNFLQTSVRPAGEPGLLHITQEGQSLSSIVQRLRRISRNDSLIEEHADEHDALMDKRAELQVRYIAAAFDFMNQPLLTVRRKQQPERAVRRRAEREGRKPPPDVTIIELRRKEYLDLNEPDEAPGDREYRHRWMVGLATGGYWQRYHTGTGRTGTIRRLILPYMKNAARTDLPILPPKKTVIVVDR